MNQHVSPPGPTVIRNQEDAFVVLPSAQVDAINCMIEIIDEPYGRVFPRRAAEPTEISGRSAPTTQTSQRLSRTCQHRPRKDTPSMPIPTPFEDELERRLPNTHDWQTMSPGEKQEWLLNQALDSSANSFRCPCRTRTTIVPRRTGCGH